MYNLLPYWVKIFRTSGETEVEGIPFQAFYQFSFTNLLGIRETYYHSTIIIVYKDGLIHCHYELITFEELIEKISSGVVIIEIPKNSSFSINNLGNIELANYTPYKTNADFIKEIEDAINALNNKATRSGICVAAFKKYLLHDSKENFDELSKAFNDLPSHKRMIMEGIENKDPLLKLMSGEISSFTDKKRRYMLNDYYDEEWTEEEFKVSDNKNKKDPSSPA